MQTNVLGVQELDSVFFDHRIREHFVCNRFNILPRLFAVNHAGQSDIEKLALTHVYDALIAKSVERGAHGLALRIQDGGFQRNKDAGCHGTLDYRM
jgi:hypothetical protein